MPPEHWHQPDWIDEKQATASRNKMMEDNIIYGGSVSYRNMCRYNSGVRTCEANSSIRTFRLMQCNFFGAIVLFQASFNVEIQVVLAHRVGELHFCHDSFSTLFFPLLDLTSNFTAIFYMTRFHIWKNIRKFIVRFFFLASLRSLILKSLSIAFTITMYEYLATIPTLWKHVMGSFFFLSQN